MMHEVFEEHRIGGDVTATSGTCRPQTAQGWVGGKDKSTNLLGRSDFEPTMTQGILLLPVKFVIFS